MRHVLPFLVLSCGILAGCSADGWETAREPAPLEEAQPLRIDGVELHAEIALTPREQRNGLMHRESLPADHGMLFAYRAPERMAFWMKNTLIPLDLGYFSAEGELLQIVRLYPRDQTSRPSESDQVQFALEMNQGWFHAHGLRPGARLETEWLGRALAARGADPAEYGLERDR